MPILEVHDSSVNIAYFNVNQDVAVTWELILIVMIAFWQFVLNDDESPR